MHACAHLQVCVALGGLVCWVGGARALRLLVLISASGHAHRYMVFLHVAVAVLGMLVVCLSGVGDLKTLLMGRT